MSFSSLGLSEPIVRAVSERGYTQPTPIQLQAIPAVLSGGDLLAGAQTGTGKTAGFTLPMLQLLSSRAAQPGKSARPVRALVLTPTRELAAQVRESVHVYGSHLELTSAVVFGGVNINGQINQLKRGVDILVATPGRLLDHVQQKTVDLSQVEMLVLDEADRMLDMGFIRDIRRILALLPKQRQNLLFSATFSDEIRTLADGLLRNPAMIEVARRNAPAELVAQRVMLVEQRSKADLLAHLIKTNAWFQVLVFTRTKHRANWLAERLEKHGIAAMAIHGNKSQGARTRALAAFKDASLQVLVATDIAARGLDIVDLPHVVNFELPNVPEDYIHRIGRTGRAGAEGEALSLVAEDETKFLADIERLLKRKLPRETIEGIVFETLPQGPERAARPPQERRPAGKKPQGEPRREQTARPARDAKRPADRPARPSGERLARNGGGKSDQQAGRSSQARRDPRTGLLLTPIVPPGAGRPSIEGGEINGNVLAPGWSRDENGLLVAPPQVADRDGNSVRRAAEGAGNAAPPRRPDTRSGNGRGPAQTRERQSAPNKGNARRDARGPARAASASSHRQAALLGGGRSREPAS